VASWAAEPSHDQAGDREGRRFEDKAAKENQAGENDPAGEFLLKVQRPVLTRPPEPPEVIAGWLESGWDNPRRRSRFEIPE